MKKTINGSYLCGKKSASSTMLRSRSSGLIWYGQVSFDFNHRLPCIFFLSKELSFSRCLKQEPQPREIVFTDPTTLDSYFFVFLLCISDEVDSLRADCRREALLVRKVELSNLFKKKKSNQSTNTLTRTPWFGHRLMQAVWKPWTAAWPPRVIWLCACER